MLDFVWHRFHHYRRQKTQVDQWDFAGRRIKRLADGSRSPDEFAVNAMNEMGVHHDQQPSA
jgi:hypothetical protein